MVGSVRDGKLIKLEGDFDHVVNEGSLCVKGMAMFPDPRLAAAQQDAALPRAGQRSLGRHHLGRRRRTRSRRRSGRFATSTGSPPRRDGDKDVPVNRTDAFAFMGGAQNTNEECYLFQKAARLLGTAYVEHQARL